MALRRSAFIAGDWGTTQLRLFLCDDHSVLASRSGKGIGALSRSPAEEFAATAGDWFEGDPREFTATFRRYHLEVEQRAATPAEEAARFEAWNSARSGR